MDHLSNSQINLYSLCSLKYKFQYIDEKPRPFKPSALALGSAVHSALSWFHRMKMNGNKVKLEDFLKIFDVDWFSQKVETDIRYKDREEESKLVIMAKEMLALYFNKPCSKVRDTEVPFVVPLINPSNGESLGINLEGFIDLIEEDDGIVEFKTSYQTMKQKDVDENLQLTAYSYAYEILYQKSPKRIKVVDFVKTKKPKRIEFETKREKRDYQRLFSLALQVLRGIQEEVFFPRTGFWCKNCEYADLCKSWQVDGTEARR